MSLIGLIIAIVVILIGFWAVSTYAPAEPAPIRWILYLILFLFLLGVIWEVVGGTNPFAYGGHIGRGL